MSARVAVVGAGWAGLAAAVRATEAGHQVTLFEMAPAPGGRAREVQHANALLDNGQHILIGAYQATLALMRAVGVDPTQVLRRSPLAVVDPQGQGLRLGGGTPLIAFAKAVIAHSRWSMRDKLGLLWTASQWQRRGFVAPSSATVADLISKVPNAPRRELLEPLCVAALNTASDKASAQVFLRVLHDALFSGAGSADLLLPRVSLSKLLPIPACRWLAQRGAHVRTGARVQEIDVLANGRFGIGGEHFDSVILACTAKEAARLAKPHTPAWASKAASFEYEPIITVYLNARSPRWHTPMIALEDSPDEPAQFAFDLGALDESRAGLFAWVVSGASAWLDRGLDATSQATLQQARRAFPHHAWSLHSALSERRATFACVPGLERPPQTLLPGLLAAGDYIDGPYPATLEGAVRSGASAAQLVITRLTERARH